MKRVIPILLISCFILGNTPLAYPCSGEMQSHRKDYREAKAIFVGKIISVEIASDVPDNLKGQVDRRVKFRVEKRWKGAKNSEITVLAYYGFGVTCHGFEFRGGGKYLIYAFGDDLYVTTAFSRSRPIERANEQTQKEMHQLNSFWWRSMSHVSFLK